MDPTETAKRYEILRPFFNEKLRRVWAAAEASILGYGGISTISKATGISRRAITEGMKELVHPSMKVVRKKERIRREGGGRKSIREAHPELLSALENLIEPATRGDPESPLRWTSKSVRKLSNELKSRGFKVSYPTIAELLKELNYSLQANRKVREGSSHPDRDAQFEYIYQLVNQFQDEGQPVISVDTKKKELVGDFKNNGREWRKKGEPEHVRVHDFELEAGKVSPYGVYDIGRNEGWINVGTDHDTASFAVESIRRWWIQMGKERYPDAKKLLITADGGGSNGSRVRLWKFELQKFANEVPFELTVCHLPPGTSKWNKIEHRLFAHITMNWRGKPLISHEVIVNLISSTRTEKGLHVKCMIDTNKYPKGIKILEKDLKTIRIQRHEFHGDWNYTILPHPKM
jgi:DNA-binding transcriptional regulator GbsR (MarR family)